MENLNEIIDIIKKNNNIVFFGGAGVSTASGIPDFRSKNGLYNQKDIQFEKYDPEYLLSTDCLYHNPKVFYEFYRQKMDTRHIEPNITHKVLAKLEQMGNLQAIVTQNIDGLHQKAGSKNVYEIHGTTNKNYCVKCKEEYENNFIFESKDTIPRCYNCNSPIRPNVVLYGENLPKEAVNNSLNAIDKADVLIIAGTSLSVYPATNFIYEFHGKHLIILNNEKPKNLCINPDSDYFIQGDLKEIFEEINKHI